ncbi:MAG: leucine-rich repeat protein [Alistipes sp.]|nr:leucine-rich repeat protein [Alistipes sp.]
MKHTLTLLCALMSFVAAVAQTQHSIIIDEQSFKAVQVDPKIGVGIDKIPHDNSNRPCARIKMHVNRMTRAEIDGLQVRPVGGNVVVMKQIVAAEGNGLIIELTAKEPTRFYLHHDKYGDSNEVSLNLEGDKEYLLTASLNVTHSIVVNANVSRADVYLDGIYQGETNDDYTLTITNVTPGAHTIKVQQGSAVTEQNVDVSAENIFFRIVVNAANSHPQYVILEVIPKSAVVIIDNKNYVPDEYGNVQLRLRNGSYTYQVSAKDYHTEKGMFVVSGAKIDKRIELLPAFGWLSVAANGALQGANIFVDDNLIGKTPITRYQLSSGKHHIRVVRDMYLPGEEIITIEDNKLFEYSTTLVADFATVTLSAEEDCDIYVNDVYKGKSPWSGTLATGAYLFEARKEGHRSTTLSQTIVATPAKQSYTLNPPIPIVGMLNITSTPARANVYIDDKLVGQTPMMCDVLVGKHEITIKREGYVAIKQNVTIVESKVSDMIVELQKGTSTPNNVIEYVSRDGKIDITDAINKFGASVISHTWDSAAGKGVITFNGNVTKIGDKAFYNCSSLTSITIPNSVTTIGDYAFAICDSLVEFKGKFAEDNGRILVVDGTLVAFALAGLTEYAIPESVTTIGDYAFQDCDRLTSVTIGDSVTTIGDGAFAYCSSLTSVTIPESVTTIGDGAFQSCSSLTSVTIGDSVTTIGDGAFLECSSLTSVTIGDSVTTIGNGAFSACSSLTSVTIPDSVTTIGNVAFLECSSLTSVTIPDSVTTIGDGAFGACSSLTSVTIPDSVTTIGNVAFLECTSLTSVTIPDSVTTIGKSAFSYCKSLTSITIGDRVTTIGDYVFYECTSLTSVYCTSTTPPVLGNDYVFANNGSGRKIYVPTMSVHAYKSAEYWSNYADAIVGYNFK